MAITITEAGQVTVTLEETSELLTISISETTESVTVVIEEVERGIPGKQVELNNDGTWVQWRYIGDVSWKNLITVEDILLSGGFPNITVSPTEPANPKPNDIWFKTDN